MDSNHVVIDDSYARPLLGYEAAEEAPHLILVYPLLGPDHAMRGRPFTFPINDPPSLATVRWMIRTALNDVDVQDGVEYLYPSNPKWPDRELDGYIRECIGFFNTYLPRERRIVASPHHCLRHELGLTPDEYVRSVAYEGYRGQMVHMDRASRHQREDPRLPIWDVDEDQELVLHRIPDHCHDIELTILGFYATPHNDHTPLDLPREHWEILSVFGQGKAYLRLSGQSAQLDRWKETGIRTDNPISPVARRLLNDAMERITSMKGPVGMRRTRA